MRDRREALEEFFQAVIVFQVLEQCLDRNPCAFKDRRPPENIGIDCNQITDFHGNTDTCFLCARKILKLEDFDGRVEFLPL